MIPRTLVRAVRPVAVLLMTVFGWACNEADSLRSLLEPAMTLTGGTLAIRGGNRQYALSGEALAGPLIVTTRDAGGAPLRGVTVTWAVLEGGGTLQSATSRTNIKGNASNRWTVGTGGAQSVVARVAGLTPDTVIFDAAVIPAGATLTIRNGDNQTGLVNDTLPTNFVVEVKDADSSPLIGVPVTWTVERGGGALRESSNKTTSTGRAANRLQLGPVAGLNQVKATVAGVGSVLINAAAASPGAAFQVIAGDNQLAVVGDSVPRNLQVELRDASGTPMEGVLVEWGIEAGSGGLRRALTTTNAVGRTANRIAPGVGINRVGASIRGIGDVVFNATGYNPNSVTLVDVSPDTFNTSLGAATITVKAIAASSTGLPNNGSIHAASSELGNCIMQYTGTPTLFSGECSFIVPRDHGWSAGTYGFSATVHGFASDNWTPGITMEKYVPTTLKITNVTPDTANTSHGPVTIRVRATAASQAGLQGSINVGNAALDGCAMAIPDTRPTTYSGTCTWTLPRYSGPSAGPYDLNGTVAAYGGNSGNATAPIVIQTASPVTVTIDSVAPDTFNISISGQTVRVWARAHSLAGLNTVISVNSSGLGGCSITVPAGNPSSHSGDCSFDVARYQVPGSGAGNYQVHATAYAGANNQGNNFSDPALINVQTAVATTVSASPSPSNFNTSNGPTTITISLDASSLAGIQQIIVNAGSLGGCSVSLEGLPSTYSGSCSFVVPKNAAVAGEHHIQTTVYAGNNNTGGSLVSIMVTRTDP